MFCPSNDTSRNLFELAMFNALLIERPNLVYEIDDELQKASSRHGTVGENRNVFGTFTEDKFHVFRHAVYCCNFQPDNGSFLNKGTMTDWTSESITVESTGILEQGFAYILSGNSHSKFVLVKVDGETLNPEFGDKLAQECDSEIGSSLGKAIEQAFSEQIDPQTNSLKPVFVSAVMNEFFELRAQYDKLVADDYKQILDTARILANECRGSLPDRFIDTFDLLQNENSPKKIFYEVINDNNEIKIWGVDDSPLSECEWGMTLTVELDEDEDSTLLGFDLKQRTAPGVGDEKLSSMCTQLSSTDPELQLFDDFAFPAGSHFEIPSASNYPIAQETLAAMKWLANDINFLPTCPGNLEPVIYEISPFFIDLPTEHADSLITSTIPYMPAPNSLLAKLSAVDLITFLSIRGKELNSGLEDLAKLEGHIDVLESALAWRKNSAVSGLITEYKSQQCSEKLSNSLVELLDMEPEEDFVAEPDHEISRSMTL